MEILLVAGFSDFHDEKQLSDVVKFTILICFHRPICFIPSHIGRNVEDSKSFFQFVHHCI